MPDFDMPTNEVNNNDSKCDISWEKTIYKNLLYLININIIIQQYSYNLIKIIIFIIIDIKLIIFIIVYMIYR